MQRLGISSGIYRQTDSFRRLEEKLEVSEAGGETQGVCEGGRRGDGRFEIKQNQDYKCSRSQINSCLTLLAWTSIQGLFSCLPGGQAQLGKLKVGSRSGLNTTK